jgi:hypothetical protein
MLALEEYVTVKQSRDIAQVMKSDIPIEEKTAKITEILKNLDQVDLMGIVAKSLIG